MDHSLQSIFTFT